MRLFFLGVTLLAALVGSQPRFVMAQTPNLQASQATPSFADFDRRAKAGERLNVVFFGCSLTWGANATDPQLTSYRARMAEKFEAAYPEARFKFWDAAIGGTSSILGVFRFERDVLRRTPDLVFLDFTLNDNHEGTDRESLAAYESLVRRTITEAHCPAVLVMFPGAGEVRSQRVLPRDEAHHAIGVAYGAGIGDAVALMRQKAAGNPQLVNAWWPHPVDKTHPGDAGYIEYAEAGWQGFESAVERKLVSRAPMVPLHGEAFLKWSRNRLSQLALPAGWTVGVPNRISAWYDSLMSRWLDDEVIAAPGAESINLRFRGTHVLLFGESTPTSGKIRVLVDGKPSSVGKTKNDGVYNAGSAAGGNVKWSPLVAERLNPHEEHTLELIPILEAGQELRIESVCVAGGVGVVG